MKDRGLPRDACPQTAELGLGQYWSPRDLTLVELKPFLLQRRERALGVGGVKCLV